MSTIQIASIDPAIQQVVETFTAMQAWPHWHEIAGGAAKEYGMSQAEFEQVLPEYQRFMALSVAFPGLGMLGPRIDILWHSHILNTIRYASFCAEYIGRFVHHLPCSSYEIYGVPGEAQAGICNEPPATCMDPWPAPPDPSPVPEPTPDPKPDPKYEHIQKAILDGAPRFVTAYTHCFGYPPPPAFWPRTVLIEAFAQ